MSLKLGLVTTFLLLSTVLINCPAPEIPDEMRILDAVAEILNPNTPIEDALDNLTASFVEVGMTEGFDTSVAELRAAFAPVFQSEEQTLVLLDRSSAAGGYVFEHDFNSGSSKIAPDNCLPKTTVIFVNGMANTLLDFYENLGVLASALAQRNLPLNTYRIKGVYNISASDEWRSANGEFCSWLGFPCTLPGGALVDFFETVPQKFEEWAFWPSLYFTSAVQRDVDTLQSEIRKEVVAGRTVVVVAHSQGNFFARAAIAELDLQTAPDLFGTYSDAVGVISVGSPVAAQHTPNLRVSHCLDPVARLAFAAGEENCMPSGNPLLCPECFGSHHSFSDVYMQPQSSTRSAIIDQILSFHDNALVENDPMTIVNVRNKGALSGPLFGFMEIPADGGGSFELINTGAGVAHWEIQQMPESGLSISPNSGMLHENDSVQVSVTSSWPEEESFETTFTLASCTSSRTIQVSVVAKCWSLSRTAVKFGLGTTKAKVSLLNGNCEVSKIDWTSTSGRISVSPAPEPDEFLISVSEGEEFTGEVTFFSETNPMHFEVVQIEYVAEVLYVESIFTSVPCLMLGASGIHSGSWYPVVLVDYSLSEFVCTWTLDSGVFSLMWDGTVAYTSERDEVFCSATMHTTYSATGVLDGTQIALVVVRVTVGDASASNDHCAWTSYTNTDSYNDIGLVTPEEFVPE